jgi:hypothetical protein
MEVGVNFALPCYRQDAAGTVFKLREFLHFARCGRHKPTSLTFHQ